MGTVAAMGWKYKGRDEGEMNVRTEHARLTLHMSGCLSTRASDYFDSCLLDNSGMISPTCSQITSTSMYA